MSELFPSWQPSEDEAGNDCADSNAVSFTPSEAILALSDRSNPVEADPDAVMTKLIGAADNAVLDRLGPISSSTLKKAIRVVEEVERALNIEMNVLWGYDPNAGNTEHHSGRAVDFMVTGMGNEVGDYIADFIWANRVEWDLGWEIWRQRIRSTSDGKPASWVGMADRGNSTANHYDHVHAYWRSDRREGGGVSIPTNAPVDISWDGHSFPGRSIFIIGTSHPAITVLGQRLVAHGFGAYYKVGPGPVFTEVDRQAVAAFQRSVPQLAGDADGFPGPLTWQYLMAEPSARPVVSLSALVKAAHVDPPAPQGYASAPNSTAPVEKALVTLGYLEPRYADGSFGTLTVRAYSRWQQALGYTGAGADGVPGEKSLRALGQRFGFDVVN